MAADSFSGIVSSIRRSASGMPVYTILSDSPHVLECNFSLELYDKVLVKAKAAEGGAPSVAESVSVEGRADSSSYGETIDLLAGRAGMASLDVFKSDSRFGGLIARMEPSLRDCGMSLLRHAISGAPAIIRFHNDGDGATGAIALSRALASLNERLFIGHRTFEWRMHRGIAYTPDSFYEDSSSFSQYESIEKPMVLILDFGTTPESEAAIGSSVGKHDLLWIDHHPVYKGFPASLAGRYLNSWDYGGNSNDTAGMLASVFSAMLGAADVRPLIEASFLSDRSSHADRADSEAVKVSEILDFLTGSRRNAERYGNPSQITPRYLESMIGGGGSAELYDYISSQITLSVSLGLGIAKRYKGTGGIGIFVLDFSRIIAAGYESILLGRYATRFQEGVEAESGENTLAVVYHRGILSIRCGKSACDRIRLLDVIGRIRESSGAAVSGGGHNEAASIRTDPESADDVLAALLSELGAFTA